MTSKTTTTTSAHDVHPLDQTSTPVQFSAREELPLLTLAELRNLDFELLNDCIYFSWSPKAAFDARETGEVGPDGESETLYDFLTKPDYIGIAAQTLLEVSPRFLPKVGVLMTVYRAADKGCGADYGVILPGACVTESKAHANRHADLYLNKQHKLMATKVYPDELVTHGNPHDFIYVPRTLTGGYERYVADVARATAKN